MYVQCVYNVCDHRCIILLYLQWSFTVLTSWSIAANDVGTTAPVHEVGNGSSVEYVHLHIVRT